MHDTPIERKVKVKVGIEIGMSLDVTVDCFEDDFGDIIPDFTDIKYRIKEKVIKMLNIDEKDRTLNNIHLYDVR